MILSLSKKYRILTIFPPSIVLSSKIPSSRGLLKGSLARLPSSSKRWRSVTTFALSLRSNVLINCANGFVPSASLKNKFYTSYNLYMLYIAYFFLKTINFTNYFLYHKIDWLYSRLLMGIISSTLL